MQLWNSEVERELGLLFSKGSKWSSGIGNQSKQARGGTNKFQMLVEDVREGERRKHNLKGQLKLKKVYDKYSHALVHK